MSESYDYNRQGDTNNDPTIRNRNPYGGNPVNGANGFAPRDPNGYGANQTPPYYAPRQQKNGAAKWIFGAAVMILLAAVIVIAGLYGLRKVKTEENHGAVQEGTTALTKITEPPAGTTAAPGTTEPAAETSRVETIPQTQPTQTTLPTVVVETAPATQNTVTLIPGNSYMVGYYTPDHAGLSLREGAGINTRRLAVVPEGTVLLYKGQRSGEYVSVAFYLNGVYYSGWVLFSYLADDHSGGDYYNGGGPARPAYAAARVSGDTPGDAGVVLRAESTYYSEKLAVLPEGTLLYLLGEYSNGYAHVMTAGGTYGWVLSRYLD